MENKCIKTSVFANENILEDFCEQPIDVDFTLPDYCPDISKIFKCKAVARIVSKGINGNSITVEGNVCITLLYCDKENKLNSYFSTVRGSQSLNHNFFSSHGSLDLFLPQNLLKPLDQKIYQRRTIPLFYYILLN